MILIWNKGNHIWFLYELKVIMYDFCMKSCMIILQFLGNHIWSLYGSEEIKKTLVRLRRTLKWSWYDSDSQCGSCTVATKPYDCCTSARRSTKPSYDYMASKQNIHWPNALHNELIIKIVPIRIRSCNDWSCLQLIFFAWNLFGYQEIMQIIYDLVWSYYFGSYATINEVKESCMTGNPGCFQCTL